MPSTIDQYREAKTSYLKLRNQAKKELLARFNDLAGQLLQLQRELLEDFGEKVAIPSRPKKFVAKRGKTVSAPPVVEPPRPPSPKVKAIERQLEAQRKKLEALRGASKPTKTVDDRIYELEDELRLAQSH